MLASQLNSASSIAGENTALYVACRRRGRDVRGRGHRRGHQVDHRPAPARPPDERLQHARIEALVSYLPTALLGIIIVSILWLDSYGQEAKAGIRLVRLPLLPASPASSGTR
jgi:hypothetical protein